MNPDLFLRNLSLVLGHSIWYEHAAPLIADGIPTGAYRNDMAPEAVVRDMGKETAQQYALQEEYSPRLGAINRQETEKFLLGSKEDGTRGMLDLYTGEIAPRYAEADRIAGSAQRQSDIADVSALGKSAMDAFRASNPQQTALLDAINADTMTELGAGYDLTPGERRLVSESVRTGQADRGFGYGPSDVFEEALATTQYGAQRKQQRLAQAYQTAGLNQATAADPFQVVLGRASGAGGMGLLGMSNANASGIGNQLFGFGADVLDFNANSRSAANIAKANNNAALAGAGISAVGDIASAY